MVCVSGSVSALRSSDTQFVGGVSEVEDHYPIYSIAPTNPYDMTSFWRNSCFHRRESRAGQGGQYTPQMARTLRENSGVMSACVMGDRLFLGTHGAASEWDLHTGDRLRTFKGGHSDYVWSILADGGYLYTSSSQTATVQWSLETGKETRRFEPAAEEQPSSPDPSQSHVWTLGICGTNLYAGSSDGLARRWDALESGELQTSFKGHQGWVTCLTVVPRQQGGEELYTGSADGTVRFWDGASGGCLRVFDLTSTKPGMCLMSLAHLDGIVYAGCASGDVVGLDLLSGQVESRYVGHDDAVVSLTVSQGHLYTASLDGTIRHFERQGEVNTHPFPNLMRPQTPCIGRAGGASTHPYTHTNRAREPGLIVRVMLPVKDCTGLISASDSNATSVNVWRDKVVITCDSTTIANALILPAQKLLWGNTYPLHMDQSPLFEDFSDNVQQPTEPQARHLPLLHVAPKRKRLGRPPKRPADAKRASSPKKSRVDDGQGTQGGGEALPKKRGPGRPRKIQPEETEDRGSDNEPEWMKEGHPFLGKKVRRDFDGEVTEGTVVAWMKAGAGEDEPALWRVKHADGDEEDLEEEEVNEAIALHALDTEEELITGDDELFEEESDVLAYEQDRLLYSARVVEVKEEKKDGRKYLVKYMGWNDKFNRWVPGEDVIKVTEAAEKFKKALKEAKKKRTKKRK